MTFYVETYTQMTEKAEGVENPNLTLRLREPEIERLKRIMSIAAVRAPRYDRRASQSDGEGKLPSHLADRRRVGAR